MHLLIKGLIAVQLLLLISHNGIGQNSSVDYHKTYWIKKFDSTLTSENVNSMSNLIRRSKSGNSFLFMNLSYALDGLLTMYEATDDIKYLKYTGMLLSNIMRSAVIVMHGPTKWFTWKADSVDMKNLNVKGKEVILFEGYMLRYAAKYCYIVSMLTREQKKELEFEKVLSFVDNVFFKWYTRSLAQFGDDSYLQTTRTHMGSHWADVAIYMYRSSDDENKKEIYQSVFSRYDSALHKNFKVESKNGFEFYTWNATWDTTFTVNQARVYKGLLPNPQDVSHGNQVVRYIIDSYEIGNENWAGRDIDRLINTLKYKLWSEDERVFPDNIDGSVSLSPAIRNTGWMQSDGWMRLMFFDENLYRNYMRLYESKKYIVKSPYNLEFYSNFACYEKLKKN